MTEPQNFKEQLKAYEDQFNDLTIRERVLGVLVLLAAIYMVLSLFWLDPILADQKKSQDSIDQLNTQIGTKSQEIALATQTLSSSGSKEKISSIEEAQARLDQINQTLQNMTAGLIDPDKLPVILEDVLIAASNLTLLKVQTLPAEEIDLGLHKDGLHDGESEAAESGNQVETAVDEKIESLDESEVLSQGIFKHTVELTVKGSYRDVHKYLQALEALEWRFYWDELNYSVDKYPKGQIKLRVYTLTTEEGWMDV
ncbi:MAG: type II secretion system protein M [Cellvibrionaceae bacterium]